MELFELPRRTSLNLAEAEVVAALVEMILTVCVEYETDAMVLAAINIAVKIVLLVETLVLVDVSLHVEPFSYLLV